MGLLVGAIRTPPTPALPLDVQHGASPCAQPLTFECYPELVCLLGRRRCARGGRLALRRDPQDERNNLPLVEGEVGTHTHALVPHRTEVEGGERDSGGGDALEGGLCDEAQVEREPSGGRGEECL